MHSGLNSFFERADYPDYPVALYRYDHYEEKYPRTNLSFESGENTLEAYLYGDQNEDDLIVLPMD